MSAAPSSSMRAARGDSRASHAPTATCACAARDPAPTSDADAESPAAPRASAIRRSETRATHGRSSAHASRAPLARSRFSTPPSAMREVATSWRAAQQPACALRVSLSQRCAAPRRAAAATKRRARRRPQQRAKRIALSFAAQRTHAALTREADSDKSWRRAIAACCKCRTWCCRARTKASRCCMCVRSLRTLARSTCFCIVAMAASVRATSGGGARGCAKGLSLIHISEPTRRTPI
eukprot:4897641-Pleurochrysis_carterae.AAC.1